MSETLKYPEFWKEVERAMNKVLNNNVRLYEVGRKSFVYYVEDKDELFICITNVKKKQSKV